MTTRDLILAALDGRKVTTHELLEAIDDRVAVLETLHHLHRQGRIEYTPSSNHKARVYHPAYWTARGANLALPPLRLVESSCGHH